MKNNESRSDLFRRARWDRLLGAVVILILLIILFSAILRSCGSKKQQPAEPADAPVAQETAELTEAPTEPVTDNSMAVFLSPSTKTDTPYACDTSINDSTVMFDLADRVRQLLEADGYTVYMCGTEDGVKTKVEQGNALQCGAYVALHTNAGGGQGTECYYNSAIDGSYALAENIYNRVAELTPTEDRGLKDETQRDLYEVAKNTSPCCLLEIEFHDDAEQAQWILDNLNDIAVAVKNGIEGFLSGTVTEPDTEAPTADATEAAQE